MFSHLVKKLLLISLNLLLLGALLVAGGVVQAAAQSTGTSRIAALQTDAQVAEFIRPLGWEYEQAVLGDSAVAAYRPYRFTRFRVRGAQTWVKADFDHNGLPDLLVQALHKDVPSVFCVLDMGTELRIVRNFYSARLRRQPVARVVHRNGQDLLEYADFARSRGPRGQLRGRRATLLAYVGGGFVEYNPRPVPLEIRQITYESTFVYHQIIETRILIKEDSLQLWRRQTEVLDSTQNFHTKRKAVLSPSQRQQLVELLSYLKLPALSNTYGIEAFSHYPRVTLTVEYGNGQRKMIEDVNGNGTAGLQRLYALLNELANP